MSEKPRLQLPEVTLLIFNPAHGAEVSGKILVWLSERIAFGDIVHMTDRRPEIDVPGRLVIVPRCGWKEAQEMQAFQLHRYLETPFLLHIETDGFPVNTDKWEPGFLEYDYVGAPWPPRLVSPGDCRVGNGGCSLQSRKFRRVLWENRHLYGGEPSDVWFTRNLSLKPVLDRYGIKIAPLDVAQRFSFENENPEFPGWKHSQSFAFHGKSTECQRLVEETQKAGEKTP